jgi:hypothetical protein
VLGLGCGPECGLSGFRRIGGKCRVRRKRNGTKLHSWLDNSFHQWHDSTDNATDSGSGIGVAGQHDKSRRDKPWFYEPQYGQSGF